MIDLANQRILESESHLRHIDELMVRAREVPLKGTAGDGTAALFTKIKLDRDRLSQELDEIRSLSPREESDVLKRAEGLKGVLETVGLELEKALGAIFEQPEKTLSINGGDGAVRHIES